MASSATERLPVAPTDTDRWVLEAAATIRQSADRAVDRAVAVIGPTELPAVTAPLVEQWALRHQTRSRGIFVA